VELSIEDGIQRYEEAVALVSVLREKAVKVVGVKHRTDHTLTYSVPLTPTPTPHQAGKLTRHEGRHS